MDLNVLWFLLLGVLLAGYAILDGFDFGVGILAPLARTDRERRIVINSIGPLWDGNEVWLVTFGGAMFAAFPELYATVFSGFYIAFMLLLFALILRAVSLEFRSKLPPAAWRGFWDSGFFLASLLAPILFGVAVGSVMVGVPVDARGIYAGGFLDILFPARVPFYPVLVGLLTASLFTMHGAIYLYLKTEEELQARVRRWMWHGFGTFLVLYLLTTIVTLVTIPHAMENFSRFPWAWIVVLLSVLAIGNIPRAIFNEAPGQAFLSSSVLIAMLIGLVGIALYPNLLVSSLGEANSLTIYNAASSPKTLGIMAIIAALGMPFVLAYTGVIYWTFR
ncbi:MAG TPA: cytochrome d ubiquinol oxidase subunit II, partial [Thermoanaerobaculia bacterium]|nr:cytochrome d ubiquinol oxidase subunit II [Thermoanaerobaculia bacterium]